jgi:hypothetical protein
MVGVFESLAMPRKLYSSPPPDFAGAVTHTCDLKNV